MQQVINETTNGLNVLIAGNCIDTIKESKILNKLYTTSDIESEGAINLRFNTFKELAKKCKALQIDLVVIENERWILEGIRDVLRANYINCIAPDSKWTNLKLSYEYYRSTMEKYGFSIPQIITLPVDYPLIVRANRILRKVNSLEEIIKFRKELDSLSSKISENIHLEEFVQGEKAVIYSIFDGKTLLTLPQQKFDNKMITEYTKKTRKIVNRGKSRFCRLYKFRSNYKKRL